MPRLRKPNNLHIYYFQLVTFVSLQKIFLVEIVVVGQMVQGGQIFDKNVQNLSVFGSATLVPHLFIFKIVPLRLWSRIQGDYWLTLVRFQDRSLRGQRTSSSVVFST